MAYETQINKEFAQYKLSQYILNGFTKLAPQKVYEIENILERFLICMANYSIDSKSIFYPVDHRYKCTTKLISELKEKGIVNSQQTIDMLLLNPIRKYCLSNSYPPIKLDLKWSDNTCIVGPIHINFHQRQANFLKLYKSQQIIPVILRYRTMDISHERHSSQQWGISYEIYDQWYKMGARYEAFASPLNTRMCSSNTSIGASHPAKRPGAFCSLFPDIDKPFGSLGNFFDINILDYCKPGNNIWCFNPPFVEDIMVRGVKKLNETFSNLESMGHKNIKLQVFGILPHWEDSHAVVMVKESKYLKSMKILKAGSYYFESDKKIPAKFDSLEFILTF